MITPDQARHAAAALRDSGDTRSLHGLYEVAPAEFAAWYATNSGSSEERTTAVALADALDKWANPAPADPASNPQHYHATAVEPIDAIEAWSLSYNLGNVVKYVARAGRKGADTRAADLQKAADYLHREIHGRWPWESA